MEQKRANRMMRRITTWCLAFGLLAAFWACSDPSTKSTTEGLACAQDYSCSEGEVCYDGKCTKKENVPATKEEKAGEEPKTTTDGGETKDEPTSTPDKTVTPDNLPASTYPAEPHGINVGDVMIPITLKTCNGVNQIDFTDLYKDKDIKVIQLTVHTIWCPSCRTQAQTLEAFYQKYKSKGLAIVYIMTENGTPGSGKISAAECASHGKPYGFTFPSYRDEGSAIMRKFFDRNAVPLNMIITTKDMKIRYKQSGALPARLEGIVASYLE